jgi:hypothetical protein
MSDFAGFLCWDNNTVAATIATEAVSPSINVFLATHAPLDIHRTTVTSGRASATKVVTEREVLKDFLQRPTNKGVLVMPVIGESGTGKSHLVRWVHAQTPSTETRQVIYLPKDNTSLAGVIDLLLVGNQGSPFDEIRRDIARLGRDISQDALERALCDQLAEALLSATPESPQERALVGDQGLYTLLHDPYFREKLLRKGSVIPRRAAHAINGRVEAEGDVPLQVTPDDLPLDLRDISEAALRTQRLYGRLAADASLQVVAADLLQRYLDVAVMQATNLGVGRVQQAFLQIRKALAGKKEIVLLVEDFALVQGVQRDLLDAILETSEREGRTVLAPVRTLMAVTTGYFGSLPPTVKTRVDSGSPYRYELRVTLGDPATTDSRTESRVVDMIGRYLNAARIGRDRLEDLRVMDAESTPNKCSGCAVEDACHAGFGTSSSGHGLYPYNKPALLRAVRATALPEHPDDFNPRAALAQIVRGVLQDHREDINTGRFPGDDFEARFPPSSSTSVLPTSVRDQLLKVDPLAGARRRVLLQFWGDAPRELMNLEPEIHTAFRIPALDPTVIADSQTVIPSGIVGKTSTAVKNEPAVPGLAPAVQRRIQEIEDWLSRGANFPTELAGEVRRLVRGAVVDRVSWTDPIMKEPTGAVVEKAWPTNAKTISIADAAEAIARNVIPSIRFEKTPENAQFFEDLVKINAGGIAGTLASRLRLDQLAESHAPDVRSAVLELTGRSDEQLVSAVRASLAGAALCGIATPGDSTEMLLSAALTDTAAWTRSDASVRSPTWRRSLEKHLQVRAALVGALREASGVSQGVTGEVQVIDAERLLPLVRQAQSRWLPAPEDNIPDWARQAVGSLTLLPAAVNEQLAALAKVVREIRELLPIGVTPSQTFQAVSKAIDAGDRHGFVRHSDLPALQRRNAEASLVTSREVDRLERELEGLSATSTFEERLRVAALDRSGDLAMLRDYLLENDDWLSAGLQVPIPSETSETSSLLTRLDLALSSWRSSAQAIKGASS